MKTGFTKVVVVADHAFVAEATNRLHFAPVANNLIVDGGCFWLLQYLY